MMAGQPTKGWRRRAFLAFWLPVAALCGTPASSNDGANSSLFGPHFGEELAAAAYDQAVGWRRPGDCYAPEDGEKFGTGLTSKCEVLERVRPRTGTVKNLYTMPLSLKCPEKGSGQLSLFGIINMKYVTVVTLSADFKDAYVLPKSIYAQVAEPDRPIRYKTGYEFDVYKLYKEYVNGKRRENGDELEALRYNLGLLSNVYNYVCIGKPETRKKFFNLLEYYRSLLPKGTFP